MINSCNEMIKQVDEVDETVSANSSASSFTMKTNRDVEAFLRTTTPFADNKHAGDTNQVECLISALRETLLTHRWKEASDVLSVLSHHSIWTVRDYTWKCGAEVVFSHPSSKPEDVELFFRKVQTSNFYHCRQKQMEKVFHLLRENRLEEAYQEIQDKTGKAGMKTKWEEMLEKEWKKVIIAYTGLVEFALWTQKNQTENGGSSTEVNLSDKHGELATNNLKSILDSPGIWDVFITCYVELRKHYDDDDELQSVLVKYNEDNPDNPNSYVYLYQYLQSIDSPLEKQLPVLEKLVEKVPSSELVLDLHQCFHLIGRKRKSKAAEYKRRCITILFTMLDYVCWQSSLKPWKLFYEDINKAITRNDSNTLDTIEDCWKLRISWWPQFHFRQDQAIAMAADNPELANIKAIIAGLFLGEDYAYVKVVCKRLPEMKENIQERVLSAQKRLQITM
ncbi:TATA box-binding protein-associated factor RNA polymerase I subunit A-like [Anneissia japonica]|uniref:TATA box-binding protein-associated factor RNA polymerase I subunit A-like n=1 Tax=Anneissia japonica TaxID=1529436 RepID=UPI001425BA50|nr:TATA box-binding protein-associated factor RNA polymerase I subunit A-like [Anneissia japonica]